MPIKSLEFKKAALRSAWSNPEDRFSQNKAYLGRCKKLTFKNWYIAKMIRTSRAHTPKTMLTIAATGRAILDAAK